MASTLYWILVTLSFMLIGIFVVMLVVVAIENIRDMRRAHGEQFSIFRSIIDTFF